MNSKVPKWMPPESAVCFPIRSEEASEYKTEGEGEGEVDTERCKRPRRLDSEEGVEEFLVLLERIEEMKKHFKRNRTNCSVSGIISGGGGINGVEEEILMATPGMQQAQGLPDAVHMQIAYHKSRSSPWKPSFQWEDFNRSNSLSAQTDLSCAAATEKKKLDEEGSIQIGNGLLQTREFLDRDAPAECSHDHVDDVNNKEEVDAPPELELKLGSD